MTLDNFKNLMADRYKFTASHDLDTIRKAIAENNFDFCGEVPYVLEAGTVDIEVEILGEENDKLYADYHICVQIDEKNWRTFDTLPEVVDFDVPDIEAEMFRLLDNFVTDNNLSYTLYNDQQLNEMMKKFRIRPDNQAQAGESFPGMNMGQ